MLKNNLKSSVLIPTANNRITFTDSGTFTVPKGVNKIYVSGCGAGGSHSVINNLVKGVGKAGDFVIRKAIDVKPGQLKNIIVGSGNTVIGDITILCNSIVYSSPQFLLGYPTGFNGSDAKICISAFGKGGLGGAFGFGGGGGGDSLTYTDNDGGVGGSLDINSSSELAGIYIAKNGGKGSKHQMTGEGTPGSGGDAGGFGATGGMQGAGNREGYSGLPTNGVAIIEW